MVHSYITYFNIIYYNTQIVNSFNINTNHIKYGTFLFSHNTIYLVKNIDNPQGLLNPIYKTHNPKFRLRSPREKLNNIPQASVLLRKNEKKMDKKIIRLMRTVSGGWPQFIRLTNRNCADSILTLAGAPRLFHAASDGI